MKVRLGITAPLFIESAEQAALRLPCFIERNFGIAQIAAAQFLAGVTARNDLADAERCAEHEQKRKSSACAASLVTRKLVSPESTIRFKYSPRLLSVFAKDKKSADGQVIRQTMETEKRQCPRASPSCSTDRKT
jgi:hypothetical protein